MAQFSQAQKELRLGSFYGTVGFISMATCWLGTGIPYFIVPAVLSALSCVLFLDRFRKSAQ